MKTVLGYGIDGGPIVEVLNTENGITANTGARSR